MNDAETRTQRRGDETSAGGRSEQSEVIQMKGMDAGARALADHQIDAEIFHGRIENFFDGGLQAMNFVKKEDFAGFERSENRGKVAFAFEKRAGTGFDGDIQFVGDDLRQRGFAKAGRAVKQNVI